MPGASGTFEDYELREEPEYSSIEKAIRKVYPYDMPTMDPEVRDAAMGFGPGSLGVAGIFKSNIANAVRKGFAEHYPTTGGKRHLSRLMEMLRETPQEVLDRIEKFSLTKERPSFPTGQGGTSTALGLFHPLGKGKSMLPEVEAQGLDVTAGRGGADVINTILHEVMGHGSVDAIKRKVGYRGSEQLIDVGRTEEFYKRYGTMGREEPIARMVEDMTPQEFTELFGPYFESMKGSKLNITSGIEKTNVAKSIRRYQDRLKKGTPSD